MTTETDIEFNIDTLLPLLFEKLPNNSMFASGKIELLKVTFKLFFLSFFRCFTNPNYQTTLSTLRRSSSKCSY